MRDIHISVGRDCGISRLLDGLGHLVRVTKKRSIRAPQFLPWLWHAINFPHEAFAKAAKLQLEQYI